MRPYLVPYTNTDDDAARDLIDRQLRTPSTRVWEALFAENYAEQTFRGCCKSSRRPYWAMITRPRPHSYSSTPTTPDGCVALTRRRSPSGSGSPARRLAEMMTKNSGCPEESVGERLQRMRHRHLADERDRRELRDREFEERLRRSEVDREFMIAQCRVGQLWEYAAWLKGYMEAGGTPTHFYDYDTPKFWVAAADLQIRPLYGSASMQIVVPEGIGYEDDVFTGHTSLFVTRTRSHFTVFGNLHHPPFVPVYQDTEIV